MKTKVTKTQSPLPYAFSRREEFLRLPPEKRTAHLWEALCFCKNQIGKGRFSDDELNRNLHVLRRMMLNVAKEVAKKLRIDGSWRTAEDPRWPRNHKGDDLDHWYDSGAFPPQFMALPDDPESWREVLSIHPEVLFDEMIAWVETPAGQAGVGDEELQKLLADRDTYLPAGQRARVSVKLESEWKDSPKDRQEGLEWLAARSADGALQSWAVGLELKFIQTFLGGVSSNRRPIEQLLPELMGLETSGDLERLQTHLDVSSPNDATRLAQLRSCLPKSR